MKARKIILYVGGFELPDKNAAAHRVIANSKIFSSLGYDVVLIGINKNLDRDTLINQTKNTFEEFTYYELPYPKGILGWFSYLMEISYKELIKEIDPFIIVAYNYPAVALESLRKYCKRNSIKLIADCTEWYAPKGNIVLKLFKGFDTWYRMHVVHNHLDGIIAISKYLFDYYLHKKQRVIYIPPLIDKEMNKWGPVDLKKIDSSSINIVYAGSVGRGEKDRLDKIIKAIISVKNDLPTHLMFIIIGLTKEQYVKLFKPKQHHLNTIADFVTFKGRLSHEETINIVKSADFEIFLRNNSRVNMAGFPTKFVEALSCGTPLLTNLSSNIGMYLQNGINGFILDTSTEESLIKSMQRALITPKEDIIKMKINCLMMDDFDYRRYRNKFSIFLKKID